MDSGGGYWHCYLEECPGTLPYNHPGYWIVASMLLLTGVRSTLLSSGSEVVVINCTQDKKYGAPSCPQEKGTGALMISG